MITVLPKPVPCVTPLGDGYIMYITENGMYENDEFTVVLWKDGSIRHFSSDSVKIYHNATYGIQDIIENLNLGFPPKEEGPF